MRIAARSVSTVLLACTLLSAASAIEFHFEIDGAATPTATCATGLTWSATSMSCEKTGTNSFPLALENAASKSTSGTCTPIGLGSSGAATKTCPKFTTTAFKASEQTEFVYKFASPHGKRMRIKATAAGTLFLYAGATMIANGTTCSVSQTIRNIDLASFLTVHEQEEADAHDGHDHDRRRSTLTWTPYTGFDPRFRSQDRSTSYSLGMNSFWTAPVTANQEIEVASLEVKWTPTASEKSALCATNQALSAQQTDAALSIGLLPTGTVNQTAIQAGDYIDGLVVTYDSLSAASSVAPAVMLVATLATAAALLL